MSILTNITRITNAKEALKTSLTAKGATVPADAKIDALAAILDALAVGSETITVMYEDKTTASVPVSTFILGMDWSGIDAVSYDSSSLIKLTLGSTVVWTNMDAATVSVYGALNETVTLTHSDGTAYTIDTNANGASDTTLDLPFGEYTVTGTVSVDALPSGRTVTVSSETTVVTAYPDGAVFWFGNGYTAGDTLYYQGFAEKAWRYSGDGEAATSGGTVSLDGTRILCKLSGVGNSTGYAFSCFREGAVDMTDYTSLNCYGKTSGGYTGGYSGWLIATDDYANNYSRSAYKTFGNNSLGTKTADVSGLSGNYYIALEASAKYYGGNGSVTLTAYAIWLE